MTICKKHDVCYCEHRRQTQENIKTSLFVKHYALVKRVRRSLFDATKIQQIPPCPGFGCGAIHSMEKANTGRTMATVHWLEMVFLSQGRITLTMKGKRESDSYLVSCWYNHGQMHSQRSTTKQCIQVGQEPGSRFVTQEDGWMKLRDQVCDRFLAVFCWSPVEALVFSEYPGILATNIDGTLMLFFRPDWLSVLGSGDLNTGYSSTSEMHHSAENQRAIQIHSLK